MENLMLTDTHFAATYILPNAIKERSKLILGKKVPFSMILHNDFFQSYKFLAPGVPLKLIFVRNNDAFSLLSATANAKIKINKLLLTIRRVTIDPSVNASLQNTQEKIPIQYPVAHSKIKTHLIHKAVKNEVISQFITGKLPRKLIFAFVKDSAFHGTVNENPFKFEHFKCNLFNLFINNEPVNPRIFTPDPENDNFLREYRWFLDNSGQYHLRSNGITYEDFKSNSFIFEFDTSPELCNSFDNHGIRNGTIDVHIGFKDPLADNVVCICYATYDEVILIDKDQNIAIV